MKTILLLTRLLFDPRIEKNIFFYPLEMEFQIRDYDGRTYCDSSGLFFYLKNGFVREADMAGTENPKCKNEKCSINQQCKYTSMCPAYLYSNNINFHEQMIICLRNYLQD